ncbi:MAG: hypothetical protein R3B90_17105 [Planctomycetaceae bacterium]
MSNPSGPPSLPGLPVISADAPVPVYDCHVILSRQDDSGRWHGVVTNLPDIEATAGNERAICFASWSTRSRPT